jgi:hypothetical protein
MREDARQRAVRLLAERRVLIVRVLPTSVLAYVRGDSGELRTVAWGANSTPYFSRISVERDAASWSVTRSAASIVSVRSSSFLLRRPYERTNISLTGSFPHGTGAHRSTKDSRRADGSNVSITASEAHCTDDPQPGRSGHHRALSVLRRDPEPSAAWLEPITLDAGDPSFGREEP